MFDDASIDESRWTIGRVAVLAVRIVVCLCLVGVIAGTIYATCLPSITWQKEHPAKPGDQAGKDDSGK